MEVRRFKAEDLFLLRPQPRQEPTHRMVGRDLAESLEAFESYTVIDGARVIACGGLVPQWANRSLAWAYLSADAGRHMVAITRIVRRFLAVAGVRRVEAHATWGAACRWLDLLGFRCETPEPMPGFLPDGTPAWLYARVRHG
jgi:hypothetical protein